jgi:hypothetical protein
MTTSFTEFLREQAEKRKAELSERKAILDEWTESLKQLYSKMREWLRSSDPDGILVVKDETWDAEEEGLGKYKVPCLDIRGLGRWIGIVPKARYTVATAHPPQKTTPERAAGRVDITNEVRRYILYRFRGEEGDTWLVDDQKNPLRILDQPAFEAALMSYLR